MAIPGNSVGRTQHLTVFAALLSMIGPFTIDAYLPSFPDIETEFGISRALLSQSLGVYLLAFACSTLLWGPLSDRIGRRRVILLSMALYTLGSVGCALAANAQSFLFLRVLQGLAASGGFIASRAMIRDAHDAEAAHREMSQVMLLFALAPAIAPVLGGWLHDHYGWRSVFWFLSAYGCLMFLVSLFVGETLSGANRQSIQPAAVWRVYVKTLTHRAFPALVINLSMSFAALFIYIAGAPAVIFDLLGMGSKDFGWLFIPIVSGLAVGATISGRLAHRWVKSKTINTGLVIMSAATLLNLLLAGFTAPGIVTVIGPLVIYVLGLALVMPAVTVLALDCMPYNRGTAASMQGFIQMMSNAAVASLVVPFLQARRLSFALGQALFLLLAVALWRRLRLHREGTGE